MNTSLKFIFSFLFICNIANARTVEENRARLNRCDNYYCNGSTNAKMAAPLHNRLAIVVRPISISMPQVIARPQIQNQFAQPQTEGSRILPQNASAPSPTETINDENSTKLAASSAQNSNGYGSGSGSSPNQFNSPAGANNNSQLKAGLLYSNDDEETSDSGKIDTKNQSGSALASLAPQSNPVAQNLKNSSVGSDSPDSAYKPSSGTSSSDFGTYQSGSPVAPKGIMGQITEGFADIAESLGEKFFGDLGGKSSRGSNASAAKATLEKQSKFNMEKAKEINPRDILKNGLAQFNNRGLANHLEFGASNTFLFGNVCQHYVNYAEKNRIPNDRSPCPRK